MQAFFSQGLSLIAIDDIQAKKENFKFVSELLPVRGLRGHKSDLILIAGPRMQ